MRTLFATLALLALHAMNQLRSLVLSWFLLTLALMAGVSQSPLSAQTLTLRGDDRLLWVVRSGSDGQSITILRQQEDETLLPVRSQNGSILPRGMAVNGQTLWIVLPDGQVQTFSPSSIHLTGQAVQMMGQPRLPLSPKTTLVSLAAARRHAWALIQQKPDRLELLRLDHGQWQPVPMPDDLPVDSDGLTAITILDPDDSWPCLTVSPAGSNKQAWVYVKRSADAPWAKGIVDLPASSPLTTVAVDGQLILAQRANSDLASIELALTLVRPSDLRAHDLGRLAITGDKPWPLGADWVLTRIGSTLCLAAKDPEDPDAWLLTQRTLAGSNQAVQTTIQQQMPNLLRQRIPEAMMPIAMALGMLCMFAFWKRDGGHQHPTLPRDIVVAGLLSRTLAAVIDLLPCLALIATKYSMEWDEMAQQISSQSMTMDAIVINLMVGGLFVAHTTVSEILTGRTLGKWLCGLNVTNLQGGPINLWQGLARGLIRGLEFIAPPLLVMMVIQPYRQRLGDLAARTLVVSRRPAETPDDSMMDDQ